MKKITSEKTVEETVDKKTFKFCSLDCAKTYKEITRKYEDILKEKQGDEPRGSGLGPVE